MTNGSMRIVWILAPVVFVGIAACTPAVVASPSDSPPAALAAPPPASNVPSAAASATPPSEDGEAALTAALDKREHGDVDGARNALADVIRRFPSSPVIPRAYLALGDIAFDSLGKPGTDPGQLVVAQHAYEAVLAVPPPGNASWGYAAYKLGWVFREPERLHERSRVVHEGGRLRDEIPARCGCFDASRSSPARLSSIHGHRRGGVRRARSFGNPVPSRGQAARSTCDLHGACHARHRACVCAWRARAVLRRWRKRRRRRERAPRLPLS
jgi:hypothetical protein